jgi:hypothetical protein
MSWYFLECLFPNYWYQTCIAFIHDAHGVGKGKGIGIGKIKSLNSAHKLSKARRERVID